MHVLSCVKRACYLPLGVKSILSHGIYLSLEKPGHASHKLMLTMSSLSAPSTHVPCSPIDVQTCRLVSHWASLDMPSYTQLVHAVQNDCVIQEYTCKSIMVTGKCHVALSSYYFPCHLRCILKSCTCTARGTEQRNKNANKLYPLSIIAYYIFLYSPSNICNRSLVATVTCMIETLVPSSHLAII